MLAICCRTRHAWSVNAGIECEHTGKVCVLCRESKEEEEEDLQET